MNRYFPYRCSPGCLTINIYFYLFLYKDYYRSNLLNSQPVTRLDFHNVIVPLKIKTYRNFKTYYSLIQMKCQGGNKYALSITVKFDRSTRRFGRISFARKLTKHIALLFYLLSPYLLSCMRGSRNVRKNMHIIKTIMKFCAHWATVCGMTNSVAGGIRTQSARSAMRLRGP